MEAENREEYSLEALVLGIPWTVFLPPGAVNLWGSIVQPSVPRGRQVRGFPPGPLLFGLGRWSQQELQVHGAYTQPQPDGRPGRCFIPA